MAIHASGTALTMLEIVAEFGGTAPHALSEYYGVAAGIPTSGEISFYPFYGATASYGTPLFITSGYYEGYGGAADKVYRYTESRVQYGSETAANPCSDSSDHSSLCIEGRGIFAYSGVGGYVFTNNSYELNASGATVGTCLSIAGTPRQCIGSAVTNNVGISRAGLVDNTTGLDEVNRCNASRTVIGSATSIGLAVYCIGGTGYSDDTGVFYGGYSTDWLNRLERINSAGTLKSPATTLGAAARRVSSSVSLDNIGIFYAGSSAATQRITSNGAAYGSTTSGVDTARTGSHMDSTIIVMNSTDISYENILRSINTAGSITGTTTTPNNASSWRGTANTVYY